MGLGLKLKLINDNICKRANRDLQELDLTLSQHRTILYLSRCRDYTAELKALEREFHVAQATVAGIAQRLEAKGYVTAMQHPTDKRIKLIRLTQQGLALSQSSLERFRRGDAQMVKGMRPEEVQQLVDLLDRVYRNLCGEE